MSLFYSHLVEFDEVIVSLSDLKLSESQKNHLSQLYDSQLHLSVLDLVLSQLSKEDAQDFLDKLKKNAQDKKLLDFLSNKVEDIEDQIKLAGIKLRTELMQDIKKARNNG